MSLWRDHLSPWMRERVLQHYLVPTSRFGLEPGLVGFLARGVPVTLVDVGASSGHFTDTVLRHAGLRRALLVEPQSKRCQELRLRFADRPVSIHECAVSDITGSAKMDILNFDYSSSLLPILPGVGGAGKRLDLRVRERVEVRVRTLDDLIEESAFDEPIDLLKVDTQGSELRVLKGAARSLKRIRLIWTEVSFRTQYEDSALFPEIHEFLLAHGFRFYSIHEGFRGDDGELLQADALFLGPAARVS